MPFGQATSVRNFRTFTIMAKFSSFYRQAVVGILIRSISLRCLL